MKEIKKVGVTFEGGNGKIYYFKSRLNFKVGKKYYIYWRDQRAAVTISSCEVPETNFLCAEIHRADEIDCMPNKNSKFFIEKVYFDRAAGVTVVLWKDKTKTIIHQQAGDIFDEEKAIALCVMKKAYGNTGFFNEELKRWVN